MLEFSIGIFFLGAMAILFYFTAVINGRSVIFGGKEFTMKVEFQGVGALKENDKVTVLGMEVGKVKSLILSEDYEKVIAVLAIAKEIPVYEGYQITVRSSSVFGGEFIQINPGARPGKRIAPELLLKGIPPVDIMSEAASLIRTLKEDEAILRKMTDNESFFNDLKSAAREFNEGAGKINKLAESLINGKGTASKFINDNYLYDQTLSLFSSMKETSINMNALVTEIRKLKDGNNNFSRFLADDSAYEKLIKMLDSVADASSKISSGNGSLGKIMNDDGKLYGELYGSLKTVRELATQLNNSNGSLGMLLKDRELYDEVLRTVKQIRASVEDFRNQAPAATFGSMALGAF